MADQMEYLQALKDQMPEQNNPALKAAARTRAIQLQQAVGAAPAAPEAGPTTPAMAQQAGAGLAQQAGTAQVQAANISATQAGQIGQMGLNEQQSQLNTQVSGARQAAGQDVHQATLAQGRDELNQQTNNETQKIAWSIQSSKNQAEFQRKQQAASQAHQRNSQMTALLQSRIQNMIKEENAKGEQKKNQQLLQNLYNLDKFYAWKQRNEQAEAADKMQAWQTGGSIVGGVVGAVAGGPGGAMAGASAGGGIGSAIGSQT